MFFLGLHVLGEVALGLEAEVAVLTSVRPGHENDQVNHNIRHPRINNAVYVTI